MTAQTTQPAPASVPARTAPARRPRSRSGDIALDTRTGLLLDLTVSAGPAQRLPRGRAQDRYRCLACGLPLEYCGPRTRPDYTARFRHTRHDPDRCNASPARQASVPAAVRHARTLAQHLHTAQPGTDIELVVTAIADGDCPPVLAVRLHAPHGTTTVHLAYTSELSPHQADQLAHAAHDTTTRHWLLYDRLTPAHTHDLGQITVRLHRQNQRLERLTPTATQRRLAATSVAVAWRAQGLLLIPFGGHAVLHQPRTGENWTGPAAPFQRDWKISHPRPATDATWWGLVPVPLRALTAPTLLAAAPKTMAELERVQHGRESYRRAQARAQFTQAQTQLPPTPAAHPTRPVATAEKDTAASPQPQPQPQPQPSASITFARPRLARLRKALRRLFRRP
ncbi:hypothetical protein OIE49_36880 [Streptomyces sp. NBC_01788]|uniref:hypothetical protein n=1 Tax=Streptomyces sp. NBC_01788 TaxID=2975940 RepID=UPI002DD7CE81|nr:hypothetical protein [Streptomyces sp. NBC_01788]WSB24483.1 hypothetical protein OIE49_00135 [Streptomyces sp. NBC_01788]WSB30965.1 hypothetical protein OIE49_36880 [Streptomyces sp. NBC_01788]